MHFLLPQSENPEKISRFLDRHSVEAKVDQIGCGVSIDIQDAGLPADCKESLRRHFSFYDIFEWSPAGVENVLLWELPHRMQDVINELIRFFPPDEFDLITSLEAKGFILAGALAYAWQKPLATIRKHKQLYDSLPGYKQDFTNWKGEAESLFLFERAAFRGKRALLVDDVLETGNSLQAAASVLQQSEIELVGAFYLLDAAKADRRQEFDFPIRSLLRYFDLFGNTSPVPRP